MNDWMEFSGKTVEEAIEEAARHFDVSADDIDTEIIEKETKGLLGIFSKPAVIKAKVKAFAPDETAKKFLDRIFESMEIQANANVKYDIENELLDINISGEDIGVLIGKRGQTLDSLQYLTSLVINKENKTYVKVKIDTENYRERRKETLENLAKNIAHKVKRTRKPVSLEPMNPYERRIIHSALQNDKFVETHSEGEEPYRKVVITLKKGVKDYSDNKKGGYYKNNKYSGKYDNTRDYKKKFNENYKKSYQSITFDDINTDEDLSENQN